VAINRSDPSFASDPPSVYALTCCCGKASRTPKFESWAYPLVNGEPLPNPPIWLADESNVPVELEASHEETYRRLRIG
jgi:hypothetical protein